MELSQKHPNIDPFLLHKWERIFNVFFDRNASKNIDGGDFYLVVHRARNIYGAESVQMGFAKESLAALWEGLCKLADADNDQKITIDEWLSVLDKVDPKNEPQWFNNYSSFMFKLFDVSCDGVMDLAEFTDGMNTYGYSPADCEEAFKLFAVDKNGKALRTISPELWKQYFHELFFSTDKKARGNHLFGKMTVE